MGGGRVNSWILTCILPCPLLSPCLGNGPACLRPSAQRPGHWHLQREQLIIYWAAVGVAQLPTAAFIFPSGFYISHIPRPCVRSFSFRQDNALISNSFSQEDPWMVNKIPPLESSSPVCLNLFFHHHPFKEIFRHFFLIPPSHHEILIPQIYFSLWPPGGPQTPEYPSSFCSPMNQFSPS